LLGAVVGEWQYEQVKAINGLPKVFSESGWILSMRRCLNWHTVLRKSFNRRKTALAVF
jgi:hypothetical protein